MVGRIRNITRSQLLTALVAAASTFACTHEASAGAWLFRRSYFSHVLPPDVAATYPQPESRSAYRRAIPSPHPSFSIRGGYRHNTINIRGAGGSRDYTVEREYWFELNP